MYLGLIDYGVLILLLIFSTAIGIYQGYGKSKQISTKEFLIGDGQMKIFPTAMSFLASLTSAAGLLGMPVETYYYGTMIVYCIFSWFIATYLTMKFFIPKFHYIGSASIYAYLEQRFSLTIRILITCSYLLVTIFMMSIVLYAPSLALGQLTGLNMWIAIGLCGVVCTIYTSIGGMKAVIWTDVVQASVMFIGLILSIVFGLIDLGGISKVFERVKNGNRLQLSIVTFDPTVRYTIWSILIGSVFSSTAQYACIQTQAQRFMCVKDTKSAQKVAWIHYVMHVIMQMLCLCLGCILYAKYSQCDPLKAKIISRSDQLYPLFAIETFQRFPGLTGLFISCMLSATLSTFSSGVNSMATVILEDIYKRLPNKQFMSNQRQLIISKILSVILGLFTVIFAFLVSYMKSNIATIIMQMFGVFAAPILGVYLLGLFSSRVKSRSVLVAFFFTVVFQIFMHLGSMFTERPINTQGGKLPTSIDGCSSSVNVTITSIKNPKSNVLTTLFLISPIWFIFNGTMITVILGLIGTFICDSKDSKTIDPLLLVSRQEIFPWCSSEKQTVKHTVKQKTSESSKENIGDEEEIML